MLYMGGKSNEKWQICRFLNQIRQPGQLYIEPFVGACNTFAMMDEPKIGIDIHPDLISMWQAVQCGWEPPDFISEEEYYQIKLSPVSPLRGFTGFGCSYAGKWFGGYARARNGNRQRNFCLESKRGLFYKLDKIKLSTFINADYKSINGISGSLIYCDPPYRWTTGYDSRINHDEFFESVRIWSQENIVIVSEITAPEDFIPILSIPRRNGGINSPYTCEYLYMYSG